MLIHVSDLISMKKILPLPLIDIIDNLIYLGSQLNKQCTSKNRDYVLPKTEIISATIFKDFV